MPAELRKLNRRWVISHSVTIGVQFQPLEAAIDSLKWAESIFVPNTARVHLEPTIFGGHQLVIRGDRYATAQEVREHTNKRREKETRELRAKRDRINEALSVLRKEAPSILNRTDVTAEDVLEELAV